MHSKIACDHNDHDHYADDVKDIHRFTPIEITFGVQRPSLLFNNCKDCDLGLSKSAHRGTRSGERERRARNLLASLYAELYTSSPMRRERQSCVGVVAHLDGFAMIFLSRRLNGCTHGVPALTLNQTPAPTNPVSEGAQTYSASFTLADV
jgi:hypothetical protein